MDRAHVVTPWRRLLSWVQNCQCNTYLVAISRNWSEADNRISRSGLKRTRSMMKVCHDLSLHRFSKHCGYNATANVKTSKASRHKATSSGLKFFWFSLILMNCECRSSMVPFNKDRSPPAEAQAKRIMDNMTAWNKLKFVYILGLFVDTACSCASVGDARSITGCCRKQSSNKRYKAKETSAKDLKTLFLSWFLFYHLPYKISPVHLSIAHSNLL